MGRLNDGTIDALFDGKSEKYSLPCGSDGDVAHTSECDFEQKEDCMNTNTDRCSQLRTLQDQLIKQINTLKESVQKMEREGVESPTETLSIIKSLEKTLNSTVLELQECPPESSEVPASTLQQQAPASIASQTVRRWFPDADQQDDEDSDSIIDEY